MSNDSRVAYALRDEYAGTVLQRQHPDDPGTEVPAFVGGLVRAGDRDLDIRDLLDSTDDAPEGVIVVDAAVDPLVVAVLDQYPALKRVPVPDEAAEHPTKPLEALTVAELRERAQAEGITGAGNASKGDLYLALTTAAQRRADGLEADLSVAELVELAAGTPDEPNPEA